MGPSLPSPGRRGDYLALQAIVKELWRTWQKPTSLCSVWTERVVSECTCLLLIPVGTSAVADSRIEGVGMRPGCGPVLN